jgi:signal peptidase II
VSSAPIKSSAGNSRPANLNGGSLPLNRYLLYFGLTALGCAVDLLTKEAIFRWRGLPGESPRWWLIQDHFGIETSVNPGALFGMGAGWWWLFAVLAVVALCGIIAWLFVYRAAHDRWITTALGLVSGGILGNLYDRLGLWNNTGLQPKFHHGVRDWILFEWKGVPFLEPWPNFNIADSLLVTGAIMLVIHAFVWQPAEVTKPASKQAAL